MCVCVCACACVCSLICLYKCVYIHGETHLRHSSSAIHQPWFLKLGLTVWNLSVQLGWLVRWQRAQRSSCTLEFQVCATVLGNLCSSEFWELNSSLHSKYRINWTVSSASGSTIWMEIQKKRYHWQMMKLEDICSARMWCIMKPMQWKHGGFQYSEREEGDNVAFGGWHLAQEQWLWGKVALGPAAIYLGKKMKLDS